LAFSQIDFEKGYFVDNDGNRIDCLIKNVDWRDNPDQFEYKRSETSENLTAYIKDVSMFGIADYVKYERHKVNVDRSSDLVDDLTETKTPSFQSEELFLKVLVEGKASLFLYEDGNSRRFFFESDENGAEPLIYKRYLDEGRNVGENVQFRQQLYSNLNCGISPSALQKLLYKEDQLIAFFKRYNQCTTSEYTIYKRKQEKNIFNVALKLGANLSSFHLERDVSEILFVSRPVEIDFDNTIFYRLGIELELMLPFNQNKWGLFFDPSYQSYKSEKIFERTINRENIETTAKIDYRTLEMPVGVRHYLFLSDRSALFLNASMAFVFNFDSGITFEQDSGIVNLDDLDINGTEAYLSFGLGYEYNKKLGVELRFNTSRDLVAENREWISDYKNSISLMVGYTVF